MKRAGVAIVGAGPAGLMAAEALAGRGVAVAVFEGMPSVGRKFLMAGKGGMNITHAEPMDAFLSRYGKAQGRLEPLLAAFGPQQLRAWMDELGIASFVGSSGRVFPAGMKAAPLLRAWLHRLRAAGVSFYVRHRWQGWDSDGRLVFCAPAGEIRVEPQATVLALGGASWTRLGSDGAWVAYLQARTVEVAPHRPANCGFDVAWTPFFRERFAGAPVKPVVAEFAGVSKQGEFNITAQGVEGGLIYSFSAALRDALEGGGPALLHLDLVPGRDEAVLGAELARPRGRDSLANHLRRRAGINGVKAALLRECVDPQRLGDAADLARLLKHLPLPLVATRPLEEAISTAGGVAFAELDDRLMLRRWPGVFCAGEMLDWEAPTGGYLLTACLASGRGAGLGAADWLGLAPPPR